MSKLAGERGTGVVNIAASLIGDCEVPNKNFNLKAFHKLRLSVTGTLGHKIEDSLK